ncbi:MFS transporter [Pedobacter hiemivivus]|uniref:MFS transporter n=1 Tax=Pedobacter hiemivivus TaxID=2530454 RepID=A0A4U1GTA0_9SPHI|nr:MFS transporter [Pedobacter hiemivivus]TKC65142.1 MFS transporter [Pedobacter hiemivivus]
MNNQIADPLNTSKNYKWLMLALLWTAFFLNSADRQIFSVVLPLIKADLNLSDAELGLIASSLVWTYGLFVPIAGIVGDRLVRKNIIVFSLLFWSVSTLLTGISTTVAQFVLFRGIATGGGEAFYAPAANALIGEEHQKRRSLALSIHQSAVYFGIILSGVIAGYIGQHYGWRNAFYLFGGFGILVAIVSFFKLRKDVPAQAQEKVNVVESAKIMAKNPTVVLLTSAFACMVFVNVAYLTWMPSLLVEKFNLSLVAAGFSSMFYHHIGAFIGVLIGGLVSDKVSRINPGNRLVVQAVAMLGAVPFIYWIGMGTTPFATYLALFFFGIFRGIYDSNIFASLYEVVKPAIRSSSSGFMLMCAFLVGAFAPLLLGVLKPTLGLSTGLSWLWVSYFLGAAFLLTAVLFFFKTDRQNAMAYES